MVDNRNERERAAMGSVPPRDSERRRGLIPWLIAAVVAIALLVLLTRSCNDAGQRTAVDPAVTAPATTAATTTGARVSDAGDPMVAAGTYRTVDFARYLEGSEPVGRAFALDRVTFASGSDALDDNARAEIANVAGVLKRYPNARVAVTGFADPEGDAATNQALSRRRAEAVRTALTEAGATAGAVSLAAEGETGATAERANRKVEVRVTAR